MSPPTVAGTHPQRSVSQCGATSAADGSPIQTQLSLAPDQPAGESVDSRQISWWPVYELVAGHLGDRPAVLPGTPAWQQLPDDHPDKWRAVLWAAIFWTLDQDTQQEHRAAASRAVASSTDWTTVAKQIRNGRGDAYVPRKAS